MDTARLGGAALSLLITTCLLWRDFPTVPQKISGLRPSEVQSIISTRLSPQGLFHQRSEAIFYSTLTSASSGPQAADRYHN